MCNKMIRMKDYGGFSRLNELRINENFCDVTIRVQDTSFPCHRVILVATMEYFRRTLNGDNVEAEDREITLNNVDANDFKQLLNFVYGCSVPVSEHNILRLLLLANDLGLQSMMNACIQSIVENNALYSLDSIIDIFLSPHAMGNTTLADVLIERIAENLALAVETGKLYRIPSGDLLKILHHPDASRNVRTVLNFVREWIKLQPDEAEKKKVSGVVPVLLSVGEELRDWIQATLMNSENATSHDPSNSIQNVRGPRELLSDQEKEDREKAQPPLLLYSADSYSNPTSDVDRLRRMQHLYKFQSANSQIKLLNEYACVRSDSPVVYGKMFFFGDTQLMLSACEPTRISNELATEFSRYDVSLYARTKTSSSGPLRPPLISSYQSEVFQRSNIIMPDGNTNRNSFTFAINGTYIYLYNNVDFIKYAIERREWFPVDGYKNTFAPSMSSLGSCIYMAGGLDYTCSDPIRSRGIFSRILRRAPSDTDGKQFRRYDVRTGKWTKLLEMKYVRCGAASCVYNDTKIYVSGGDNMTYFENSRIEYYDVRAGKWGEVTTPMPKPKIGHCCMAYNDHLWFFGGREHQPDVIDYTWFSYDMKGDTWSNISTLPMKYAPYDIGRILSIHPADNISDYIIP